MSRSRFNPILVSITILLFLGAVACAGAPGGSGQTGPAGPQGLAGAAGSQGEAGPARWINEREGERGTHKLQYLWKGGLEFLVDDLDLEVVDFVSRLLQVPKGLWVSFDKQATNRRVLSTRRQ